MFVYEKKLQYPVRIANPNPKLAAFIISQYGGPDGFWIYKVVSTFLYQKRVSDFRIPSQTVKKVSQSSRPAGRE